MKIIISGGSGFIGQSLKSYFESLGFDVLNIGRKHFKRNIHDFKELFREADVIIHLSGASIFKRWTSSYKEELERSRIETLEKIYTALKLIKDRPGLLIAASAVGVYSTDDHKHTEKINQFGKGFMPELVQKWEKNSMKFNELEDMRVVVMRLGVVLGKEAPAYKKMLAQFKMLGGGRFGKGTQAFPMIHIDDLKALTVYFMQKKDFEGVVNVVTPEIISNKEFAKKLGKALKRPSFLIIPSFVLYLLKGKASMLLTKGQKVVPERLVENGYRFKYPNADAVIQSLTSK